MRDIISPSWFYLFAYISHTGALQVIRLSRTSASFLSSAQNDKKKKCACSKHYKSKSSWEDKKQETSATSDITDCDSKPPTRGRTLWWSREVAFTSRRRTQFIWVEPYFSPKNFLQKSAASALVILKLSPWKCPPGKMALISASMWLKISESFVRFRL